MLGLEPGLVISEGQLQEKLREASKRLHPDAGGSDGNFTALQEALATLASPSRRLKAWLESRGLPVETRGSIDPSLLDLFVEIGAITQKAEELLRKREAAGSALVRALLENETQSCREAVAVAIDKVGSAIAVRCDEFPTIESAAATDVQAASALLRNLAFLERWRISLRSYYARLL